MFDAFGVAFFVAVVYALFVVLFCVVKKNKINVCKVVFINFTVLYFLLLASITLLQASNGQEKSQNFVPFVNMLLVGKNGNYFFQTGHFFRYLITSLLNVILFIPFGFIVSTILNIKGKNKIFATVLIGAFLLSLIIEFLQYVLPLNRISDVDDLIFNTIGAIAGFFVFLMCSKYDKFKKFLFNVSVKK